MTKPIINKSFRKRANLILLYHPAPALRREWGIRSPLWGRSHTGGCSKDPSRLREGGVLSPLCYESGKAERSTCDPFGVLSRFVFVPSPISSPLFIKGRKGTNATGGNPRCRCNRGCPSKDIICKGFTVTRAAGSLHFLPLTSRLRGGLSLQVAAFGYASR